MPDGGPLQRELAYLSWFFSFPPREKKREEKRSWVCKSLGHDFLALSSRFDFCILIISKATWIFIYLVRAHLISFKPGDLLLHTFVELILIFSGVQKLPTLKDSFEMLILLHFRAPVLHNIGRTNGKIATTSQKKLKQMLELEQTIGFAVYCVGVVMLICHIKVCD